MKKRLRYKLPFVSAAAVVVSSVLSVCVFSAVFVSSIKQYLVVNEMFTGVLAQEIRKDLIIAAVSCAAVTAAVVFVNIRVFAAISRKAIKAIENIDDVNSDSDDVYEELLPIVKKIRAQRNKRKEIDRMKRHFTANVSHELKTPLTSITGYAELIENGMANEQDTKRFAGIIHNEAQRLITLTGDIIKLSQLEEKDENAGDKNFSDVDIYDCAYHCIEALSIQAEKKGVTLNLIGEHCTIKGVKSLIEDLIYNLTENAIRYNKPGGTVTIDIGMSASATTLRVADTGIGIPEKNQKRVFERFYRVDKSRSKATGGTGLGLAIVKHIVEYHNAEMTLDSKEDVGTKITIKFRD